MFKIEYSPQALEDLKCLSAYLSTNWGENVSTKTLKKLTSDIRRLELYPLSGVNLGKIIDITINYFCLFSERNYAFYRIEFDIVLIVRVLGEKRMFAFFTPLEVKKILLALEYTIDGKRLVDFDLFYKNKKIYWYDVDVNRGKKTKVEEAKDYRLDLYKKQNFENIKALELMEQSIINSYFSH